MMNSSPANHGSSTWNPVEALTRKLSEKVQKKAAENQGGMQKAQSLDHATQMQANQHDHDLKMLVAGHVLGKDAAEQAHGHTMKLETLRGKNAVSLSQTEAEGRLKEQVAGQRHEKRMAVLNHNNTMEQAAQSHHLATGWLGSTLRHAEGGSPISVSHNGISASFVKKTPKQKAEAPAQEAPAQEAPAEEQKPAPKFVGQDKSGRFVSSSVPTKGPNAGKAPSLPKSSAGTGTTPKKPRTPKA